MKKCLFSILNFHKDITGVCACMNDWVGEYVRVCVCVYVYIYIYIYIYIYNYVYVCLYVVYVILYDYAVNFGVCRLGCVRTSFRITF